MARKPETKFRKGQVDPFIKKLKDTVDFSIQQVAIRGVPDKLLCIRGRFVAIEIKSALGKLTALQGYNMGRIEKAGGISIVVSPNNWEQVKTLLLELSERELA